MKVIGSNNGESYVLQVSKQELCNILGYYSPYDEEVREQMKLAEKGESVQISNIYRNYHKVKGINESPHYDMAVTKLKEMLEAIEPINELIKEIKETYEAN